MPRHFRLALLAPAVLAACLVTGCQRFGFLAPPWTSSERAALARARAHEVEPATAAKLTPKQQIEGKFALARTVEQAADLDRAAAAYEDILKSDRKHAAAHHRLAIVYDRQGKFAQADEHFQAALRTNPQDAELVSDYGYSLYLRGAYSQAENQFRDAVRLAPGLSRAHNNLGLLLARSGRLVEAIPHFQAAGGSPAEAHANAASALMLEERWPEAHEQLAAALAIDPNCTPARKRLDEVRQILARTAPDRSRVDVAALSPPPSPAAFGPGLTVNNGPGVYSTR